MVTVKYNSMLKDIHGPVGAVTFCKHPHSAPTMKQAHPPARKRRVSEKSSVTRNALRQLSKLWKSMTPEERAAWNRMVGRNPYTFWAPYDIPRSLVPKLHKSRTAKNAFMSVNIRLITAGLAPVTKPPKVPTLRGFVSIKTLTYDPITGNITLTWEYSDPIPPGSKIQIWGMDRKKAFQLQILTSQDGTVTTIIISGAWISIDKLLLWINFYWRLVIALRLIAPDGSVTVGSETKEIKK